MHLPCPRLFSNQTASHYGYRHRLQTLPVKRNLIAPKQAVLTDSVSVTDPARATSSAVAHGQESLDLLEWPAVCEQVAALCETPMAAQQLVGGWLPIGRTQEESERLLEETREAMCADVKVNSVFDLQPALTVAQAGGCLSTKQLEGVAKSLEGAYELRAQVTMRAPGSHQLKYPLLASLAGGITDKEKVTLRAIRHCVRNGSLMDDASEGLRSVRQARKANLEELRGAAESWSRTLAEQGASETKEPVIVRGRFCVAVRAGRQSALPKGSVKMGSSSSGATLYIEPAPLVPLNNQEALLAQEEESQEVAVRFALSAMLAECAEEILLLQRAVVQLDIVAARARHAKWLRGSRPTFVKSPFYHIPNALHPLLLQPFLDPLPRTPSPDDFRFERDYMAAPSWEQKAPAQGSVPGSSTPNRPRPLELCVPSNKSVVAITGPNTGGKTVTLKTMGLLAVMAKAGLYLPLEKGNTTELQDVDERTHPGPQVMWFDQVLVDIGDSQSLEQNLSTFSGHVRRLRRILAVADRRSLVLLDEVGSGTDPQEGAALARALLDRLAGQARLTVATTHHAELKTAGEEDPRYVNVSMEFDVSTLRPTYRLCWGLAGASNALQIAQALGFDSSVISLAQQLVAQGSGEQHADGDPGEAHLPGPATSSSIAANLQQQIADLRSRVEVMEEQRQAMEGEVEGLRKKVGILQKYKSDLYEAPANVTKEHGGARQELKVVLSRFRGGEVDQQVVEEVLSKYEAVIPERVAQWRGQKYVGKEDPKVGDYVHVRKWGPTAVGPVIKSAGQFIWVELPIAAGLQMGLGQGNMKGAKVKKGDVVKVEGPLLNQGQLGYREYAQRTPEYQRVMQEVGNVGHKG